MSRWFHVVGLGLLAICACDEALETSSITAKVVPVSTYNRLSFNRLSFNRLSFNRLSFNRLSFNRLSFNRLSFNSLDALETTPEGRDVLTYVARCALPYNLSLVASSGGTEYEFPGLLGLAPEWEYAPLSLSQERMISACLLAHVNAFDISVPISVRTYGRMAADSVEQINYPVYEGTFFGYVFSDTGLFTYACYGDDPDVAREQSPNRDDRVCTDSSPDCLIISLGKCSDVCGTFHSNYGWTDCTAGDVLYTETVSVYLAADDSSDTKSCAAGTCNLGAVSGTQTGHFECAPGTTCVTQTNAGAISNVNASGASTCNATVNGAGSEINCVDADTCTTNCLNDASCVIDCQGAEQCANNRCSGNSECLLRCDGAANCGFSLCAGAQTSCGGDIIACNRPCP